MGADIYGDDDDEDDNGLMSSCGDECDDARCVSEGVR